MQNNTCPKCKKVFSTKYTLQTHLKRLKSCIAEFKCDKCDSAFRSDSQLVAHIQNAHKSTDQESSDYTCSYCEESFMSKLDKDQHLETCTIKLKPHNHLKNAIACFEKRPDLLMLLLDAYKYDKLSDNDYIELQKKMDESASY